MKFIDSKLIQKTDSNHLGKYHITIEVTDYDIEMFEEFGNYATAVVIYDENSYYHKMNKYLKNVFHNVFQRLWRIYDVK